MTDKPPTNTPDEFLDANQDDFVDTQVITNAPEWTGSIRANVDFPLFGGLPEQVHCLAAISRQQGFDLLF